jgi:hypothetical protein
MVDAIFLYAQTEATETGHNLGWQHCLDRWILPNLGNKLLSEVWNAVFPPIR